MNKGNFNKFNLHELQYQIKKVTILLAVLVKQVFSDMEFLGWYASGEDPSEADIKIHKQVINIYKQVINIYKQVINIYKQIINI